MIELDWTALLYAAIFALPWLWLLRRYRQRPLPSLGFSRLADLDVPTPSWRVRLWGLPRQLQVAALLFLLLGFANPRVPDQTPLEEASPPSDELREESETQQVQLPTEGVAVFLVLDQSGSMRREVNLVAKDGSVRSMRRMDLLKQVTQQFIRGNASLGLAGRPDDLIGLLTFARVAEIRSPLTLDHGALLEQLQDLDVVGQRDWDGTAIGYALFKTVNLILATRHYAEELQEKGKPAYEVKSQVVVLVTDGFEEPNPLDRGHPLRTMSLENAADFARENDVRVYIVNVEPAFERPELTEYRKNFTRVARATGGEFFVMSTRNPLHEIYQQIDQLERSRLPSGLSAELEVIRVDAEDQKQLPQHWYSYAAICIGLGLLLLAIGVFAETVLLRRLP